MAMDWRLVRKWFVGRNTAISILFFLLPFFFLRREREKKKVPLQ